MESGGDDRQGGSRRQGRRVQRKLRRPDRAALAAAALAYLARFAASSEMLRRVLMRRIDRAVKAGLIERDEGAALVEQVVGHAAASGLLDDEGFALQRARSLLRRGKAPAMVKSALAAKGVESELAGRALAALGEEMADPARSAALSLARRRRLGPFRMTGRAEHRERDLAILARAGHAMTIARWVVDGADAETLEAELEQLGE
jgi:regulatory protein